MSARKLLVLCGALLPGVAAPGASADVAVPVTPLALPVEDVVEESVDTAGPVAAGSGAESAMAAAVNRARAARGRRPLRGSVALNRSAHRYAAWMLQRDYFGHLSRIRAGGHFRRVGETLAMHSYRGARIRETVRMWLHSPVHRSLLLSRGFRAVGAGQAVGEYQGHRATTWVLHFGA
jgi:uncharacterized protein YkwD